MKKPKPLKKLASARSEITKWKSPNVFDLDQAALLSFFHLCLSGLGGIGTARNMDVCPMVAQIVRCQVVGSGRNSSDKPDL